jgi:DNA-binding transcriptional regulator YhcF (GntR family)
VSERRQPRYEILAQFIAELVGKRALEPGAKAPSLRDISLQHQVSISTAMRAYHLLEERGVLEVRPQSGHYVATSQPTRLEIPSKSKPSRRVPRPSRCPTEFCSSCSMPPTRSSSHSAVRSQALKSWPRGRSTVLSRARLACAEASSTSTRCRRVIRS